MNYAGKYLTIKIQDECYGIPTQHVKEILQYQPVHPIPHMPGYIAGVLNLRGKVLPIMDLRKRFNFSSEITATTCIVIVAGVQTMGLIVDAVDEVLHLAESEIESQQFGFANYIIALAKHSGGVKILLDVHQLSDSKIEVEA